MNEFMCRIDIDVSTPTCQKLKKKNHTQIKQKQQNVYIKHLTIHAQLLFMYFRTR